MQVEVSMPHLVLWCQEEWGLEAGGVFLYIWYCGVKRRGAGGCAKGTL